MSERKTDQNPDPNNLQPEIVARHLPSAKPLHARPLPYPTVDLPRYDSSADLNLRGLLRIIRKRQWLILGITFIATTLVTIQVFQTKSLYEATATVEIGHDGGSGARVGSNAVFIQAEDDLLVSMNTSEVTLKSAPLLEDVVARLQLDQNPAFLDVTRKKSLLASIQEIVGKDQKDRKAKPAVFTASPVNAKAAGSRSPEEAERLAPFVGILENSLRVRPIRDTRDMMVTYTHTDPAIAASIANAIAGRFAESSFDKKVEGVTSASNWLDRSTRELKAKVERSEQALADYTKTNNIYSLDGKGTLISGKLTSLHDLATRAETDRILKQSLYEQVLQGHLAQIPEAFADPKTAELQRRLGELQVSAGELSANYGPKYPKVAEINQQIAVVREQIAASSNLLDGKLRADYARAVRDEQALNVALDQAKAEATKENQGAIQFSMLKQDVDTSKSLYTEFLQKTNQANLEVAQQSSNIRIIDPARTPKSPVSPNRQRTILMGLLVGLFSGIGLAWVLERLDDTIRNTDDVDRYTQLPTLAVIPAIRAKNSRLVGAKTKESRTESLPLGLAESLPLGLKDKKSTQIRRARLMEYDGRSPVAEAYRGLRTGLLLSAPGRAPKTILVTSVRMGDGKTTTASNIAISLAQLGASVVIVDCDLRKPSIQGVFGVPQGPGVSTYLTRKGKIDEITYGVPVDNDMAIVNLHVIPAGPTPPNPSELLSSEGMKLLLEQLEERYDHVVIDSPPLGSVTDPVVLSTLADGVILVVHGGKSSRQAVQRGCQELTLVGAKIFGIVLNNVDLRREGYDDYHYYSYYSNSKSGNGSKAS